MKRITLSFLTVIAAVFIADNITKAKEIQPELSRLRVTLIDYRSGTRYKFN